MINNNKIITILIIITKIIIIMVKKKAKIREISLNLLATTHLKNNLINNSSKYNNNKNL